ncbi:MAG: hypothetical protein ACI8ZM_000953 [Crocinitomix sp.]|jgi:hypothetical protein
MKVFSLLLLSVFFITSCDDSNTPADAYLPNANGQHGEILILMDDGLWNGAIGEAVVDNLSRRAIGVYLRPETMFSFFRKRPEDLNHMNQLNRNILKFMVVSDTVYDETVVLKKRNYYAKGQLFVIVKDSDPNRLYEYAQNGMDEVVDEFNNFEMEQLISFYEKDPNKRVKEMAENKFGISISVPKKSELKSEQENFTLIKRDRSKNLMGSESTRAEGGTFWIQQGFMIWNTPYFPDSTQMTVQGALMDRDSTLKYNVPGEVSGTYMGTEKTEFYDPKGRVFNYNGHEAVELRGLWIYEGDRFVGGGGPFVQYSILNEAKNEIVTVSGYVYGPKYEKREYIRELDAVLNTIVIN